MNSQPLRVGVLGTGSIAQVVHLPMLGQMASVQLAAVCDVDNPKALALAGRFGITRVHRRDEEVFADPGVDAIVICSPSHLHETQAIAALRAGKHVLVEKPLALDAEGAERVLSEAQRADRALMVAMNHRYRPDVVALKPFLRGRELGEVFFMKGGFLNRKVRVIRPTWRHRLETAGGGALMDLGVQILDLCLWMLDYPPVSRVVAFTHPGERMEVEDSAAVLVGLDGGQVISVEVTWSLLAQKDRQYLQLLGTTGSANLSPLVVAKETEHGLIDVTPTLGATGNVYTTSYRRQLEHFVAAASGREPIVLPAEQVDLMRVIALAYTSAREGREVEA